MVDSAVIIGDEGRRVRECTSIITQALARYDCTLVPFAILSPDSTKFEIRCQPNNRRGK